MTASPRPGRLRHPSCPPIRASFGWLPDPPDQRDILYASVRPVVAAPPETIDLRSLCSPVEDQGSLGSCTAQALVGALEYLERKDNVPCADLSRLLVSI